MAEMLQGQGLGALVVKSFDREELTQAQLDCILPMLRVNATNSYYKRDPFYINELRKLGVVSLFMKHFAVYYHMFLHGVQSALILEDDAYMEYPAQLLPFVRDLIATMPSNWELAVIGGRFADHAPHGSESFHVKTNSTAASVRLAKVPKGFNSRCTHAYLLRITAVLKLFRWLPMTGPIDWHVNWMVKEIPMETYWLEPPLFGQGMMEQHKTGIRDRRFV